MEVNGHEIGPIVDKTFYSRCSMEGRGFELNRNGQKVKKLLCKSSDTYHFTIRSPLFLCRSCHWVTDGANANLVGQTDDSSFVESLNQLLGLRQTEPDVVFMDTYDQDNFIRLYKEQVNEVQQKLYRNFDTSYNVKLFSYVVSLGLMIDPKFERISGAEIMSLAKKSSEAIFKGVQQASLNKQITEPPKVQQSNPKVTDWAVKTQPTHEKKINGYKIEPGAQLQASNLYEADLRGANLAWADLTEANLNNAKLDSAMLDHANLRGANLRGANLRGANLCGANLCNANLIDADLSFANLVVADLRGADLSGADLSGADLRGATMPDGTKNP